MFSRLSHTHVFVVYTVYMFISILYLLLYIYVFYVPLYMVYENKDDWLIKFVSDLRQVAGFLQVLRFPLPINWPPRGKHHKPNHSIYLYGHIYTSFIFNLIYDVLIYSLHQFEVVLYCYFIIYICWWFYGFVCYSSLWCFMVYWSYWPCV